MLRTANRLEGGHGRHHDPEGLSAMLPPLFARWLPAGVAGLLLAFSAPLAADESLPPLPPDLEVASTPVVGSPGQAAPSAPLPVKPARVLDATLNSVLPPLPASVTGTSEGSANSSSANTAAVANADSGPAALSATEDPPAQVLGELSKIADLRERSLALQRAAKTWIGSEKLSPAHEALTLAAGAALSIASPSSRDQHLTETVTLLLLLADADLRLGKRIITASTKNQPTGKPSPLDPQTLIEHAEVEWARVAYLAARISDPTYRSESMFRLVDGESFGARAIAREFRKPGAWAGAAADAPPYLEAADRIFRKARQHAESIERVIWRDRALAEAATNAAGGLRFELALEVARRVQGPETRTDALIRIAETQALRSDHPEAARATYEEAAKAVASIAQPDPRAVLTTALIDNLILVGRYEDARANIALFPDRDHRLKALATVAFSQGRHGDGPAAKEWIARDIPAQFRPLLNRKVEEGILEAVEEARARSINPVR